MSRKPNVVRELEKEIEQNHKDMAGMDRDLQLYQIEVSQLHEKIADRDRKVQELMRRADDYKAQIIVYKHVVADLLDKILEKIQ